MYCAPDEAITAYSHPGVDGKCQVEETTITNRNGAASQIAIY